MDVFEHHLGEMKASLVVIDSLAYIMPALGADRWFGGFSEGGATSGTKEDLVFEQVPS